MIAACERPSTGAAAVLAQRMSALVPVLTTPRLTLRGPEIGDFAAYAEIACSGRGIHIGGPMSRQEAWTDFTQLVAAWLLRGHGVWTVMRDDRVAGFVLLGFEWDDHEPELGFLFRAEAEGQGFAHEAASALRDHAFGALGWTTVVSYIDPTNTRSVRLAERLGGVRDGVAEAAFDEPVVVYRYRSGALPR